MKIQPTLASRLGGALLALALLPPAIGYARAEDIPAPRADFYLALGDSLTVGFQPDPSVPWTRGWVYQLRDMLAKTAPI